MLTKATIEDLKSIPLFRGLTEDELRYLARDLEERDYKKEEIIYEEGDISGFLYIVQQGRVEITKKVPTGHRQVIAVKEAGSFFGEISFFENRQHGSRVKALMETRLILLNKLIYDATEREKPILIHKLLREIILVVSANLENTNDMFLQMIHYLFYGGKSEEVEIPKGKSNQ